MQKYYEFVEAYEKLHAATLRSNEAASSSAAFAGLLKEENFDAIKENSDDAIFERIMLGFRTANGVDVGELGRTFGSKCAKELMEALVHANRECEEKLWEVSKYSENGDVERVRLTDPEGFLVSTDIISTVLARMPTLNK